MQSRGKPRRPPSQLFESLEKIIEQLHYASMPPRVKAKIASDVARVYELEGRLFDAMLSLETAQFFSPTSTLARELRRLSGKTRTRA